MKLITQVSSLSLIISSLEWIVATINKQRLLSKEKLKAAFALFDVDGSGAISSQEIKEILSRGQKIDDRVWQEIIDEVDIDGNGEIDFQEFSEMMHKIISNVDI